MTFFLSTLFFAFLFFLDFFSKKLTASCFFLSEKQYILPFLDFYYVHNKGVSFGFLSGVVSPFFLGIISISIVIFLFGLYIREWKREIKNYVELTALGFIIVGALGNIYDRFVYGFVIDFLHFHTGEHSWFVFNLADAFINIGVGLFIFSSLKTTLIDKKY